MVAPHAVIFTQSGFDTFEQSPNAAEGFFATKKYYTKTRRPTNNV